MVMITETHLVEDVEFKDLPIGTLFTFMGIYGVKLKVSPTAFYCLVDNLLFNDQSIEGLLSMTVSVYPGRVELENA